MSEHSSIPLKLAALGFALAGMDTSVAIYTYSIGQIMAAAITFGWAVFLFGVSVLSAIHA